MAVDIDKNLEKPKAGEAGWLVSLAEDLAREQEFGPSGDTLVSSGELSSRRSSQGPSQASQEFRSSGSVATGESSCTLRPVSGSQPPSQASSQKLSQVEENSSQPMSQPSSIDVLASQAVSSQLLALAAAESQANVNASQDVLVPGPEGEACCDISKEVTMSTLISQDIFSPEDLVTPSPETSQEETPLPSQEENPVSPSFDMFAPSQETANASALVDQGHAAGLKPMERAEEIRMDAAMETSDGGPETEADSGECAEVDEEGGSVAAKRKAGMVGSMLKSSSQSGTTSFMSAESGSEDEEVAERGKGKDIGVKEKQLVDSSDDEGSVASDLNKSVTSALKTPDVPRLVVPGLLGAVLQKFGKKNDQATRKPMKFTAARQTQEVCAGISIAKRKERVDEKSGKKSKVAKKSATPMKFPKLARVGSTSAGKVVKRRAHNALKSSKLKKSLAPRSKFGSSSNRHQQISTASALLSLQKLRTAGTWVRCTIQECGKWRKLEEMDPSQVVSKWECRKNPDVENNYCAAPEAKWTPASGWVHNRFTVGSLVWATVQGFPAWPAMVDDDPDTGSFFWTGVKEDGEWELRPSHYHVVFFDQRAVSRAWVLDGKMTSFSGLAASLTKDTRSNARLMKAVQLAEDALKESLVTRRARHCLAARFKGPWGPVWPDWADQQRLNAGNKEKELVNDQRQQMRLDSASSSDTSMEEEEYDEEEAEEVQMKDLLGNEEDDLEEAASQLMPADVVDQLVGCESNTAAEKVRRETSRRGSGLAKLWQDKSLFTQELSQVQTEKQQSQPQTKGQGSSCQSDQQLGQPHGKAGASMLPAEQVVTLQEEVNVEEAETLQEEVTVTPVEDDGTSLMELETSFNSEVGEDGGPSQELQVALEIAEAITPVKPPSVPGVPGTPRQDLGSKKASVFSTPSHGVPPNSLATSTPDQARKVTAEVDEEDSNLNNTAGSNAFSADGSFLDL